MRYEANTATEYINQLPEDRKLVLSKLRKIILKNIPKGFSEIISYGMIAYVVPHSIYPKGYHVNPKETIGIMAIASQKHFVTLYHFGIYVDIKLSNWFVSNYFKTFGTKPDMGKSCIRFKNLNKIPFELIGELSSKLTCKELIATYEKNLSKKRNKV